MPEETTPDPNHAGVGTWLRRNIMTGVLVSAPVFLTFYLLYVVVTWLDGRLLKLLPPEYRFEILPGVPVPGLGIVAGAGLLLLIGLVARNFIGRRLVLWFEALMARTPLVRGIYGAVKQVVEAFGGEQASGFREVVMVPFPHKDSYALGFITGKTKGEVQEKTEETVYNVFIPTTPNPTSGYLLFVPEHVLVRCDMTVDEGLKLIVSGGIVAPPVRKKRKPAADAGQAAL